MHNGRITGVKPATLKRARRRLRVAKVARHHHVTAHGYLTHGRTIVRHFIAIGIGHAKLSRRQQLYTLPSLDARALGRSQRRVRRTRFANRDEWSSLGEAIDMRDRPSEFALDSFDR